MKVKPLVSIVTVSFNQAEFLEECILSVINQSYKNIEYILYDGGSTDGSIEIIEKYRKYMTLVNIGPDGGAAPALNAAFRRASGVIHAYINSDDVLNTNAVEVLVNEFIKHPDASVVFGDIDIIDETGKPTHLQGKRTSRFLAGPFTARRYCAGAAVVPQQASAWKREVFTTVGGFDDRNTTCWDGEFFADAAIANFKFRRVSQCIAKFRVHSNSISNTSTQNQDRRLQDHLRINSKWDSAGIVVGPIEALFLKLSSQTFRVLRYVFQSVSVKF